MSRFTWGTVTAVNPLRVQLDGDTVALPFAPDSLIDPFALQVGARVRCELSARRVIVVGRSQGAGMRRSFPTKAALDAFTGWPGLVGFVEADNSEYVWRAGWNLWNKAREAFTPTWINWATPGNSTIAAYWLVAAGVAHFELTVTVGSTAVAWSDFGINSLPVAAAVGGIRPVALQGWAVDASAGTRYLLTGQMNAFSQVHTYMRAQALVGSHLAVGAALGSVFAPAASDTVQAQWSYLI